MDGCIVCGSTCSRPLYAGILECQACNHAFADASLQDEEIFELYQKSYFFGDEYRDYIADKRVIQKNFGLRLNVLNRYLKAHHQHLLEIGSAYGFFLDTARSRFDSVKGIDITDDGVRYAREHLNLDVIHADFLKHDFGNQKFDVVCMWDTIEHLRSPRLYLKKIGEHTEKGSLLAITTGDRQSLNARFKKGKWRLIHPPTHLHYFSKKTLSQLLYNHGFEVVYSRYCGFYRSIDNMAYNIFALRQKTPFLYRLLQKSRVTRFDIYLNLYDIIYAIARKR